MRVSRAWLATRVLLRMRRGKPVFMSFNVSNRCNERCPMCAVPRVPTPELTLAELEPIFRQVRKAGILVVELSGGEPFLRQDIFEVVGLLGRIGLHTTITTNGTVLPDGTIDNLRCMGNLLQLGVSLDSLDPVTYATLRGADSLSTVLQTIDILAAARLPFPLKLNLTLSRFNYREALDILVFAKSKGLFLSAFPVNSGATMAHRRKDAMFDADRDELTAIAEVFWQFAKLRREGEPLWEYSGFYQACAEYVMGRPLGPCDAGRLYLDLHADGQLSACVDLGAFADLRCVTLNQALKAVERQAGAIAACNAATPCCYTCTMNVSETARHSLAFAWETARVLAAARSRPRGTP